jgi:hypothetical protein
VEREVCREVYAPVPVTPEDTGVLDDMGNPEEALVELKKGLDVLVSVTATSTGLGRLQV